MVQVSLWALNICLGKVRFRTMIPSSNKQTSLHPTLPLLTPLLLSTYWQEHHFNKIKITHSLDSLQYESHKQKAREREKTMWGENTLIQIANNRHKVVRVCFKLCWEIWETQIQLSGMILASVCPLNKVLATAEKWTPESTGSWRNETRPNSPDYCNWRDLILQVCKLRMNKWILIVC